MHNTTAYCDSYTARPITTKIDSRSNYLPNIAPSHTYRAAQGVVFIALLYGDRPLSYSGLVVAGGDDDDDTVVDNYHHLPPTLPSFSQSSLLLHFFRQYLCVCRAGEAPAVSVWDVAGRKRLRFLSCGEMGSEGYVAAAFSPDEQMVAAQGGAPDWTLVLFVWEKGKVKSCLLFHLTICISIYLSLSFFCILCLFAVSI